MPIKPKNIKRYPVDWKSISNKIKVKANNCCEFCGVENYSIGYRDENSVWHEIEKSFAGDMIAEDVKDMGFKVIKIILTVAHMDHQPENCDDKNLKALCQKCHNNYDRKHRNHTRYLNRFKNMSSLF